MQILVDADACPKVVREVICKCAMRNNVPVIFVANSYVATPKSMLFKSVVVGSGFDVADDKLVELVNAGDIVITADIPLADRVVQKNANAINPRGSLYTASNIKAELAKRNLMAELRETGQITGGVATLNNLDKSNFANALDKLVTSTLKKRDSLIIAKKLAGK